MHTSVKRQQSSGVNVTGEAAVVSLGLEEKDTIDLTDSSSVTDAQGHTLTPRMSVLS